MTLRKIADLINTLRVHQISVGEKYRFENVPIVEVNERFFVRQHNFSNHSWYHAFQKNLVGAIKCENHIIPIQGVIPKDKSSINPLVTRAFQAKYGLIYDAMTLSFNTEKHENSTLELIPTLYSF